MQYFGGKARIAKDIVKVLKEHRKPGQVFLEPFCGSGKIVSLMDGERIASDIHEDVVLLLKSVAEGTFSYPESISEEQYKEYRHKEPSALRGFIGHGCSFAGKWWGGYARNGIKFDYCKLAANSLKKQAASLMGVNFATASYLDLNPKDNLVYCDPPYAGTTQLTGRKFNTAEFWDRMRLWSADNTVIISEYNSPDDFECIWQKQTKTDIRGKDGKIPRIEKLFKLRS